MSAPISDPIVAATTSSGMLHGAPVIGSMEVVSAARKPANGSTSSDGIGMMTLSMATHRATPRYPTAS
jgi:hypothetical protein